MALSLRGTIRICRGSEQLGCDGRGETPGPGSPGLVLWVSRTPGESALTSPPPALMDSLCAFVLEACLHVRLLCLGGGMGQVEEKGASSARPGLLLVCVAGSHTPVGHGSELQVLPGTHLHVCTCTCQHAHKTPLC